MDPTQNDGPPTPPGGLQGYGIQGGGKGAVLGKGQRDGPPTPPRGLQGGGDCKGGKGADQHSLSHPRGHGVSLYRPSDGPLSSTDNWLAICSLFVSSSLQTCQGLSDLPITCPLTGFQHYPYAVQHATSSLYLPCPFIPLSHFWLCKIDCSAVLGKKHSVPASIAGP